MSDAAHRRPAGMSHSPHDDDARWVRPVLARLGVAISRRRAYAASHPMVQQAEAALAEEVLPLVADGRALALGVGPRELLVDGIPVEAGSAITRDLADRLYRRGVGALTIQRGASLEGLRDLLSWITSDVDLDDPEARPTIPGITVGRIAYDRLTLADADADTLEIDALWRSLAQVAFDDDRRPTNAQRTALEQTTPEELGDALREKVARPAHAEQVGFVLGAMATQVVKASPAVREELSARLERGLRRLGESSIAAVVQAVGRGRDQRRFVAAMCDALPVHAVVEWLEMAGRATDQQLSHHLLRILSKLSAHASASGAGALGGDIRSDQFRDAARGLVTSWELGDPNPDEHVALLDQIALLGATDTSAAGDSTFAGTEEAARLVQMACELDSVSEDATWAVEVLAAGGRTRELLAWLDVAPAVATAAALRAHLLSPTALTSVLVADPFDAEAARYVLASVDRSHAPLLLDALQAATSRTTRRLIYNRLRAEGASLYPELSRRLSARPAWYVIRNLLSLVRDTGGRLGEAEGSLWISDVTAFQSHSREQVRLEALRLLVSDHRAREAAISRALDDVHPAVITAAVASAHDWMRGTLTTRHDDELAVEEAGDGVDTPARRAPRAALSRELAMRLMKVVDDRQLDDATAVLAIETLRQAPNPIVRQWLLELASTRTTVLRRITVAPASPPVIAALVLLRDQYASDPAVAKLLKSAPRVVSALPARPADRRLTPQTSWTQADT